MKAYKYCVLAAALMSANALAQSTDGYGTTIRLPLAVSSGSYSSTLFVRNGGSDAASVKVTYYGAPGTPFAGERPCTTLSIAPGAVSENSLATLCGVPIGPASNYGQVVFVEQSAANIPISVFTRIQAVSGAGFSVEGFKIGSLTGGATSSTVSGLRRQAAAPGYQSNCFVGSVGEPVTVTWSLRTAGGAALGTPQTTNLSTNETVRFLDVFSAAGAPAGDYSNVQAVFSETTAGSNPGFVAYCTTQENVNFDGDFRIAKEADPDDLRSKKVGVSTSSALGTLLGLASGQDQFGLYLQHPDWVQCRINGTNAPQLEMRLEDPQGNVVAGGNNISSFQKVYLGEKSTRNNGVSGLWVLKVESRNLLSLSLPYGVTCETGNGSNPPLLVNHSVIEEF
ncbi:MULTISPECIES: hypothetical protein [Lysobacter]|uniref:Uncharacterized protein n=1 Tax=Lysobacter gummosus TaxID=262324 RepID=A0ABY3X7S7_9GAMM|nr:MULTISPECIES: hypothetical protein [Lysobacter]UJB20669.1 hypothetical protein L1A79_06230 [Lysobacter capsici]UJQ30217.1 hypothetical protein L2D09_08630 [Lysobacter gummosus]UNP28015.1 hypothetical protein MOV92_16100 [Lysobacter gummosus]